MQRTKEGIIYSANSHLKNGGEKYSVGKTEYDRVSSVIKRMSKEEPYALNEWKKRVGEERAQIIGDKTSEIGTMIHKITALHDLGNWKERDKMMEKEPKLVPYYLMWDEWIKEYVKKIIAVEVVVFDSIHMIAGTIDRVFQMVGDKKLTIGDIKTGGIGYDKIKIQVAGAYMTMWNENRREWKRKDQIADRAIVIPLTRWKIEEEIEMGKEDKEIKEIRVKEVTSKWAEEEWERMRKEWAEMK